MSLHSPRGKGAVSPNVQKIDYLSDESSIDLLAHLRLFDVSHFPIQDHVAGYAGIVFEKLTLDFILDFQLDPNDNLYLRRVNTKFDWKDYYIHYDFKAASDIVMPLIEPLRLILKGFIDNKIRETIEDKKYYLESNIRDLIQTSLEECEEKYSFICLFLPF